MLPINTILGELHILEIYEFYHMPVLFACQNRTGHIYIAVWIDETEAANIWLYTPLSPQRFNQLRKRALDLHNAFVQPEDDFVLRVIVPKSSTQSAQVERIPQAQLDRSWAPLPGNYLTHVTQLLSFRSSYLCSAHPQMRFVKQKAHLRMRTTQGKRSLAA